MTTLTNALSPSNSISNATDRAHQMVDSVADKATPAVQSATAKAHETIDRVASAGNSAAEWAATGSSQLADKSAALADACSGYVRARPLVSLAGAMAIGYFVGRVIR